MRISDWSSDVCSSDLKLGIHSPVIRSLDPGDRNRRNAQQQQRVHAPAAVTEIDAEQEEERHSYIGEGDTGLDHHRHVLRQRPSLDSDGRRASGSKRSTNATISAIRPNRSEEHTPEPQPLMRISYPILCLKEKHNSDTHTLLH